MVEALAALSSSMALAALPFWMARILEQGSAPWYVLLAVAVTPVSLVYAISVHRDNARHLTARLLSHPSFPRKLQIYGYVLYLRPFGVDRTMFRTDRAGGWNTLTSLASHFRYQDPMARDATWETRLIEPFRRLGEVVAVGRPGEPFPLPGAERFYLPKEGSGWQAAVGDGIRRARLVVLVATAGRDSTRAAGTLWEYTEAVRLLPPSRLVLLICGDRDGYERFREGATAYFAERAAELGAIGKELPPAPILPEYPEPIRPARLRDSFPLRGVIRFDADLTASLTRVDPTRERGPTQWARWRRTLRTHVAPLLEDLERQLPGEAVHPARFHWHWQAVTLAALLFGLFLRFRIVSVWQGLLMAEKYAMAVVLSLMLLLPARFASMAGDTYRLLVKIRLPGDGERQESAKPFAGTQTVVRHVMRWPGPLGIGLHVVQWYRDEKGEYIDAPRRPPPWRPRRWRTVRTESLTLRGLYSFPGIHVQAHVLRVLKAERAPSTASGYPAGEADTTSLDATARNDR
ncbi:hypothetical protein [Streptomyces sp. NPDC006527]|uniref:hypothetical protein n=1 Tax=Streptomyces sp. NPDC006527 TaxID=3364749 RepID=UPI0036862874